MQLPLFVRRIVCRYRGCDLGRIVKYGASRVVVGEGCRRCEVGSTQTYDRLGPLPATVRDARSK